MNKWEQQRKFSERSTIENSKFDAMNTNQTRYSNGQGKNALPTDREQLRASSYAFSTGFIYLTGVLFASALFVFVIPLFENIVSPTFYSGAEFLLYALLFCVIMGYLWVYVGLKLVKKYRS